MPNPHRYHPYYCEENIWHLCQEQHFQSSPAWVVYISNQARRCALWFQRNCDNPEAPMVWDYHVILVTRDDTWTVWDLNSILPSPIAFTDYARATWCGIELLRPELKPSFRVIPSSEYIRLFSSDRSHMLDEAGNFIHPPPAWPPIVNEAGESNLDNFIDTASEFVGDLLSLEELSSRFS